MKRIVKNLIYTVLVLSLVGLFAGCQDIKEDEDASNSFKVISSGGPVNGYYILNDESPVEFSTALSEGSSFCYAFEKNLISPESVVISAWAPTTDISSITIYIYEDSNLVDPKIFTPSAENVKVTALWAYTFDAAATTTTTTK